MANGVKRWTGNQDANEKQLKNLVLDKRTTEIVSLVSGIIAYHVTENRPMVRAGSSVERLAFLSDLSGVTAGDADTLDGQNGTFYLDRTNHTGTQLASTISDFMETVITARLNDFLSPDASVDFGNQKINNLSPAATGLQAVNKNQLDGAVADLASTAYVTQQIATLTDGAPEVLDTFLEAYNLFNQLDSEFDSIASLVAMKTEAKEFQIGDGTNTQFDLVHNLGSRSFTHDLYLNSPPYESLDYYLERPDVNTARLIFDSAPSNNEYVLAVIGGLATTPF